MDDQNNVPLPSWAKPLYESLPQLSNDWIPVESNTHIPLEQIYALYKTLETISEREWQVTYQSRGIADSIPKDSDDELKKELQLLSQESYLLSEKLAKMCWPWVSGSEKRGGRRFKLDTNLWYSTLAWMFGNWRRHVIEKFVSNVDLDKNTSKLYGNNDLFIRMLYWWLDWQGFELSYDDLRMRLAPHMPVGIQIP